MVTWVHLYAVVDIASLPLRGAAVQAPVSCRLGFNSMRYALATKICLQALLAVQDVREPSSEQWLLAMSLWS